MSESLSPQIRVFALVGIIAATAVGAFFFLFARPAATDHGASAAPARRATPAERSADRSTRASSSTSRAALATRTGFPLRIDRALRRGRVVVVTLFMPGSGVDRVVLAEARAGARASRAAHVPVSAVSELAAGQVVAKAGVLSQPAVLVVRPPGVVTATLGVTDRATIAQAVASARG